MTIRTPSITIRRQSTVYTPGSLGGNYIATRHIRRMQGSNSDQSMPLPAAASIY